MDDLHDKEQITKDAITYIESKYDRNLRARNVYFNIDSINKR